MSSVNSTIGNGVLAVKGGSEWGTKSISSSPPLPPHSFTTFHRKFTPLRHSFLELFVGHRSGKFFKRFTGIDSKLYSYS